MADNKNYFEPGGETEEIILDDEEFELLLAQTEAAKKARERKNPIPEEVEYEEDDITVMFDTKAVEKEISERPSRVRSRKLESDDEIEEIYEEDDEEVAMAGFFKDGLADKLVYLIGGLILLFVIIIGVVFVTTRNKPSGTTVEAAGIGKDVAALGVIGEEGITKVFSSWAQKLENPEESPETPDYDEIDEQSGSIDVNISLTSILRDLKIKFLNSNNKLIANVPFEAEVTDSKGKTSKYTDEDKDGIIYITDMAGGNYSVKMVALESYKSIYSFNTKASDIKVKNEIEYVKVDVSNEVKPDTEASPAEDSANNDTAQEGSLKDTVEFVLSTRTALTDASGYEPLNYSKIPNPKDILKSKNAKGASAFKKLAAGNIINPLTEDGGEAPSVSLSASSVTLYPGESQSVYAEIEGEYTGVEWKSGNPAVVVLPSNTGSESIDFTAGGVDADTTVSLTCYVYYTDEEGVEQSVSASMDVTVKKVSDDSYFSFSTSIPASMTPGTTFDFLSGAKIEVKDKTGKTLSPGEYTLSYESSNSKKVSVADGVLTAKKAGSATITITCSADNMTTLSQTFSVTVAAEESVKAAVNLSASKIVIFTNDTDKTTLKATVSGVADESVTWASSDESIVKIDQDGNLTGVSAGDKGKATATITCTSKAAKDAKATCEVTVLLNPKDNTVQKLTDKDGNPVYVYDESKKTYREAVYADYFKTDKFYSAVAVTYKYTGWWTLDGKTYFFDKNGTKVTGDQVILGTKYSFSAEGVLVNGSGSFGIDVSKWNGNIDWGSVAKSGVSFAIIRSGFRGSTEGGLFEDTMFAKNIKNATANGIKVGVYFFTQATNEVEAVEEASMVLGQISGYTISYPIFLDVESAGAGGRAEGLSAAQRTAVIRAFCKTISNGGYTAGVYANKSWFENKINTSELTAYKIWLAQYNTSVTYTSTRYDLWQYSSTGSISGISGNVDLDRSYLGY